MDIDEEVTMDADPEDGEVSELCDMLAGQPLWCGQENILILQCSFDVTRRMLEKGSGVRDTDVVRHISEIKNRYRVMIRDVPDWLDSEKLKFYAQRVLSQDDPVQVLLSAFYVDHELMRLCNLATCQVVED